MAPVGRTTGLYPSDALGKMHARPASIQSRLRPVQQQQQTGSQTSHLLARRPAARVVIARGGGSTGAETTLIIGGGPAGIATALMLSRRGWRGVTVLEKLPINSHLSTKVSNKSYVYSIDGRGRQFTDLVGLTDKVREAGVAVQDLPLIRVPFDGPAVHSTMSMAKFDSHMMPRKAFMGVLHAGLDAAPPGAITIVGGASCSEVRRDARGVLQVVVDVDGTEVTYEPGLLVGADGINSRVRKALESWDGVGQRFAMNAYDSPAAGLKFKILRLPPNPPGSLDGSLRLLNQSMSVVVGKGGLRLGMLPCKDPTSPRTANIILKPDHPFWSIKSVDALYECLEFNFPQLPIREMVTFDEAEEFVSSSGGSFPKPQHCGAMHMLIPPAASEAVSADADVSQEQAASSHASGSSSEAGTGPSTQPGGGRKALSSPPAAGGQAVLLIGDAVHCFPPDMGQGVNSALEDVVVLNQALDDCGDRLHEALPLFEERRMPDVEALIGMMVWAGPYQYRQDNMRHSLWMVSTGLHVVVSKLLPAVPPPVLLMMQNGQLSYREIARRAADTSRGLYAVLGAIVFAVAIMMMAGPHA